MTLCYQLDDRRKLVGDNSADEQRAALLPGQIGESLRKRARRDGIEMLKLPPPIWALVYVLIAVAISWFFSWSKVPGFPLAPLGISLVAISWILPVWAIVLFRREGTEIEPTSPTNRKLITSGPYQFTRNPMYLGLVILTLGIAIWIGAWPMFGAPVALFATANWVHVPFEEAKMRRQFGAAYDNYVARVRRWI